MYLILTQNEITLDGLYDHWMDVEGERYQFPNQYIGKIKEGTKFIYYRGTRRANNKRGVPEYFGVGEIGQVWLDPNTDFTSSRRNWKWFCNIEGYLPFLKPVPFKIGNRYIENISSNQWGVGVRNIEESAFNEILQHAGLYNAEMQDNLLSELEISYNTIKNVTPQFVNESFPLLIPRVKVGDGVSSVGEGNRRSKHATLIGNKAEEIVYNSMAKQSFDDLRWIAREGEKPGWDIQYRDSNNLKCIEVKGTAGKAFLNVEVTRNEWNACEAKGHNYSLYLVADCLSTQPKIQIIENPFLLYQQKKLNLEPLIYRLYSTR